MKRYVLKKFEPTRISRVGIESLATSYTSKDGKHQYRVKIWDTPGGEERFTEITPNFFRQADGAIVVYDLTRHDTFVNA